MVFVDGYSNLLARCRFGGDLHTRIPCLESVGFRALDEVQAGKLLFHRGYGLLNRHGRRVRVAGPRHHGAEALQIVPHGGVDCRMAKAHGDVLDARAVL